MQKMYRNISMLYRFSKSFFNQMLSQCEISCGQLMVLLEILQAPGTNQDQIAESTGFDKGTVARCCAVLQSKGLVERTIDPANRRAYKLYTTKKLADIQEQLNQSILQYGDVLCSGISEDLRTQTSQCLDTMAANARIYHPDNGV